MHGNIEYIPLIAGNKTWCLCLCVYFLFSGGHVVLVERASESRCKHRWTKLVS